MARTGQGRVVGKQVGSCRLAWQCLGRAYCGSPGPSDGSDRSLASAPALSPAHWWVFPLTRGSPRPQTFQSSDSGEPWVLFLRPSSQRLQCLPWWPVPGNTSSSGHPSGSTLWRIVTPFTAELAGVPRSLGTRAEIYFEIEMAGPGAGSGEGQGSQM